MGLSRPPMSGGTDRAERMKQALRENLKRRKAQARAQARPDKPEPAASETSAGEAPKGGNMKSPHEGSE